MGCGTWTKKSQKIEGREPGKLKDSPFVQEVQKNGSKKRFAWSLGWQRIFHDPDKRW